MELGACTTLARLRKQAAGESQEQPSYMEKGSNRYKLMSTAELWSGSNLDLDCGNSTNHNHGPTFLPPATPDTHRHVTDSRHPESKTGPSKPPVQCPKCFKTFGAGANEMSVVKHMAGRPILLGTSLAPINSCPGVHLSWDIGSFWTTYPFHIHDPVSKYKPGYHIISLHPPQIRSNRCQGNSASADDIDVVKDRACRNFSSVRTEEELTQTQLRDKLAVSKATVNKLRLEVNPNDKIALVAFFKTIASRIGEGGSWDKTCLQEAAQAMADRGPPLKGAPKTADSIKGIWAGMKKIHDALLQVIQKKYPGASGWTYNQDSGFSVCDANRDEWKAFVKQHSVFRPFANKGWELFDAVHEILPTRAKGCHVYYPAADTVVARTAAPTPSQDSARGLQLLMDDDEPDNNPFPDPSVLYTISQSQPLTDWSQSTFSDFSDPPTAPSAPTSAASSIPTTPSVNLKRAASDELQTPWSTKRGRTSGPDAILALGGLVDRVGEALRDCFMPKRSSAVSPTKQVQRARKIASDDQTAGALSEQQRATLSLIFGRDPQAADAYVAEETLDGRFRKSILASLRRARNTCRRIPSAISSLIYCGAMCIITPSTIYCNKAAMILATHRILSWGSISRGGMAGSEEKGRDYRATARAGKIPSNSESAHSHLATLTEVVQFLGSHSITAQHRIFPNAAKEGWGRAKLLEQLRLAAEGKYTARNYTQYEIDLTISLYELGGAGAVHAMNHSIFTLPSLNTIQPYRRRRKLVPCVDRVRISNISHNISVLFGAAEPDTKDQLAIEQKIEYMPETDQMVGFCLKHLKTSGLETVKVGDDIRAVEAAVMSVKEGKVHIAHETSVGAISHLLDRNYGAKPVFLGPTCKKGTWRDSVRTTQIVLEAWKRSHDGEAKHGPILEVSTDGDPGCRLALFLLCMHDEILPGNPLYEFVKNLPGLNLRVGDNNLTKDPDYKHEFKRTRGLLCSSAGICVNNICINRDLLTLWLERLPDHDWSKTTIHTLLDPADAQHVGNAIQLLLCIVELRALKPEDFDPSEAAELEALHLLGETFNALLQPFINPNLSLCEQIDSLITFSHLLCGLYLQHGTSFMPNQLYADLQATVKNAILLVPKMRLINGQLKVFICLLGDDVLEALFGRCQMIGGHSPNCTVCQLRDQLGSAMNLDYVYDNHPELERHLRWLKLTRTHDLDHLRPPMWEADLTAGSCDLEKRWPPAVKAAEGILLKYNVKLPMPFREWFKKKNTDLLQPFGGKYPAISTDIDRSMVNISAAGHDTFAEAVTLTLDSDFHPLRPSDIYFDAMYASEAAQQPAAEPTHSVFAKIDKDGHLTHKKAICRTLFDMTYDSHSSNDRLQHIRGFTIGGKSWIHEETRTEATLSTHFQLGNIFSTLICYNGTHIELALAKCTLIKRGPPNSKSPSISAVPLAELSLPASPYTIYGQIFSLLPISSDAAKWAWNGEFVLLSLKQKKGTDSSDLSHLRNLQFSISSRLIDPMHDKAEEILMSDIHFPAFTCQPDKTWVFSNQDILNSWDRLWSRVLSDSTLHDKFPTFTGVFRGIFPYQGLNEPSIEFPGTIRDRNSCHICHKPVKDTDRKTHAGSHILKALRGVNDPAVKVPVSAVYPCGMCGASSANGACQIRIKSAKADSDCPHAYAFQIQAASTFRESRPCTNVPLLCPLNCNETHWKYNFSRHLTERHPSWEQLMPPEFLPRIQISRAEQCALGIPVEKFIEWPTPSTTARPTTPPPSDQSHGTKRQAEQLQCSPPRRDKENEDPRLQLGHKRAKLY
ncbi:hypothetical protein B0H10DRAFT_2200416 [Mycena sp. CBHHK59/15]|nr:hypothetical protein B0H10DRAFT_2200416 [Mycena sp. CBHHK59/15]